MKRLLCAILALCIGAMAAGAQEGDSTPLVSAELSADSIAVGQPLVLRVTVLVPTWMPEPPVFPSFEMPNVITRLPSRASGPVSQKVDGETWSGVSRAYRLYPMTAGSFSLPSNVIRITYADPGDRSPRTVQVQLAPIVFSATIPKGAEGLDPLVIAKNVDLEQSYEGPDKVLREGDAVVRKVTARISGSSVLFLPKLVAPPDHPGVRTYAVEPSIRETEDRGVLSGSRTEGVTYVARYAGTLDIPDISLTWFNVASQKVETATLAGRSYDIDAPERPRDPLLTRRQMVLLAVVFVGLGVAIRAVGRWVVPWVKIWAAQWRERRIASEPYAARNVIAAIQAQDLQRVATARSGWTKRLPVADKDVETLLDDALLAVGQARYGDGKAQDWAAVQNAFDTVRQKRRDLQKRQGTASALPPLNPY